MSLMNQRTLCRVVFFLLILVVVLQYQLLQIYFQDDANDDDHKAKAKASSLPSEDDNNNNHNLHLLCSRIPRGITAASVWQRHKEAILQALIHPRDVDRIHTNWTRQLLDLLTPTVLEKSLRSSPTNIQSLQGIYTKLCNRLRRHPNNAAAPPVKIFVFGGSIVEGSGCNRSPSGKLNFSSLQECAWPYRLQFFLDTLIGNRVVHVDNLAAGGTHSEAAIPVLEYWLSPAFEDGGTADIIINAYSANDNLPPAFHATTNSTIDHFHLYRIAKRNQDFIQAARTSSRGGQPCSTPSSTSTSTPLILYVNDYLGNQQEPIWGEGQLDEMIQWLADDIDPTVGYVSPAHMVKHWVLANTSESVFSGPWKDRKGLPAIDVHFGMAGHVTTLLAVVYSLLQLTLDVCESTICHYHHPSSSQPPPTTTTTTLVQFDLPSKEWVEANHPTRVTPKVWQQSWTNASEVSKEQAAQQRPQQTFERNYSCQTSPNNTKGSSSAPCIFAFLAAPLGTHQREDRLAEFLRPFILRPGGWQAQDNVRRGGFQNKLGLVATKPSANMALGFHHIHTPVRVVTIQYLKSFGPQWSKSRVRLTLEVFWKQTILHTQTLELEGFHDQTVSISYFSRWELEHEAPIGSSIRFQMELIGGETFKINAMMFCSR
jgi:hypothetical protein